MNKRQLIIFEAIALTFVFLSAALIFGMSSQNASESSSLSYEVTDVFVKLADPDRVIDHQDAQYQRDNGIVRQVAHAFEYALLGFFVITALAPVRRGLAKKILICVALCAICAVIDEWHQSFVDGRGSELTDVLTDIGGSCVGWAAALMLRKILLITAAKGAFWRMKE